MLKNYLSQASFSFSKVLTGLAISMFGILSLAFPSVWVRLTQEANAM